MVVTTFPYVFIHIQNLFFTLFTCKTFKTNLHWIVRAIFNNLLRVVESNSRLLWFCFTSLCDWLKKTCATFSAREKQKPKPIAPCMCVFSRTWCWLHVIISNSHCFSELSSSLVNDQSNCFGFGFMTLNNFENHSKAPAKRSNIFIQHCVEQACLTA